MAILNPSTKAVFGLNSFVPRGYIDGLILANNGSDANNDIDFAAGECSDSSKTALMTMNSLITKRLDANFSVGSGNGGLDTGAKANSTWYHCYCIKDNSGTVDGLFSTSATSPTMPSGFGYKRRIGSIKTDGSGNIYGFFQINDVFAWKVTMVDANLAAWTNTRTLVTISTPLGIVTFPKCVAFMTKAATQIACMISSPSVTDVTVALGNYVSYSPLAGAGTYSLLATDVPLSTNTSSQVAVRSDTATVNGFLWTYGWIDPRGKDS
jgi:hypothetical protein